ncbi:enoyl-CoA hydratase-related protein [Phenylobacterium sp.]|uniref:enoyl-CoA hydratase-related protein n=1 Tax=Phenylobacterium sp. TaxID=1871053 RepID=UPI0025D5C9DB|nr:enoyl-CoA hydratase-related protein [Phenylobacterium sp.]MBX3484911.1 enoyl-CoA hydratase/isomerase family protein [Phenylobacterium sp.]MCW5758427.1 enoyl-CoA hydratase/isomerase family protein [Phenylobacterium sp.]
MAYEFIKVDRAGPVTTITLNRPEVMNAMHSPAHFEMDDALNAFAADPEQWVGIVTGAGDRAFSAGNDLKYQAGGGQMKSPPSGFAGITARFDLTKPLIAAVNGVAMGGGFEIALACDIIVASEAAVFSLPEPRVGLAALAGGLHRLPRAIGTKRAMGMILTARRVSAAEGKDLGFVHEVTAPQDLLRRAGEIAAGICELGPMSIRASKQAVLAGLDEPSLEAALRGQNKYPAVAALYASEDFKEGPLAFAQKRAPNWKGR